MRVRALKDFRDKYTGKVYKKGSVFEVSGERAAEINTAPAAPLVRKVKQRSREKGDNDG